MATDDGVQLKLWLFLGSAGDAMLRIRLAKTLPRTATFHATLSCLLGIVLRKPLQSYRITGGTARATRSVSQSCVSRPRGEDLPAS